VAIAIGVIGSRNQPTVGVKVFDIYRGKTFGVNGNYQFNAKIKKCW